jgi:hypothetical protein
MSLLTSRRICSQVKPLYIEVPQLGEEAPKLDGAAPEFGRIGSKERNMHSRFTNLAENAWLLKLSGAKSSDAIGRQGKKERDRRFLVIENLRESPKAKMLHLRRRKNPGFSLDQPGYWFSFAGA